MEVSLAIAICLLITAALALELRISSAVLEVLAGLGLALLISDISQTPWLEFLANLGMLALMFVAGFDLNVDHLRRHYRTCMGVGASSFFIPFIGVSAFVYFVLGMGVLPTLLIGVALSTTSLALVYHELENDGSMAGGQGTGILAAASVVDVLSMVTLALLLGDAGWGTAALLFFVVVSMISFPRIGSWIFHRYRDSPMELELRFLLVVLIGMGFLGHRVGSIHPAIVAFTLGVAMSGVVVGKTVVKDKLKGMVFSFLAPMFFLHAGTRMELTGIDLAMVYEGAALFLLAVGLKFIASAVPAHYLLKMPGTYIGMLFNYRLSYGIIAAEIGLQSGQLSQPMYDLLLLVILASAALAAFGLKRHSPAVSAS